MSIRTVLSFKCYDMPFFRPPISAIDCVRDVSVSVGPVLSGGMSGLQNMMKQFQQGGGGKGGMGGMFG